MMHFQSKTGTFMHSPTALWVFSGMFLLPTSDYMTGDSKIFESGFDDIEGPAALSQASLIDVKSSTVQ